LSEVVICLLGRQALVPTCQEGLLRGLGRGGGRREGAEHRRRGGLDRLDRGGDGRGELQKSSGREGGLQLPDAVKHFKLLQFKSHNVNI
jgi:hypothetical protein